MATLDRKDKGSKAGERTAPSEQFKRGLATRRQVMGDAYVDAALGKATDFTWPMQELVTEYCWDNIWNRPGLDRRARSILNLGMIAVLNRPHELRGHIRGAINNGVTKQEIQEIFLQVAIYVGVPAGIDSFRHAQEVFTEMGI
ncbi:MULTISPECIES: carboxymuconolactone decarboxylase family protein [Rhizobium]|jgi:4-carboxymuconolactone decarboxylase|uniref:Gamma-carboxymuconolactone decarboxylase protein n=13 Tax=Rhizobium TaxID=379 RepID=Q8KL13_RHIEC|nr:MULTISPECIES: carboxymuconolactone decarboxylase family protein [Rhizobium]ACE93822.1 gamma-carboxymuconolactone decarboxylase protein [Rhizobium etli CIAT 652]AJC82238.1 4-carboxymuconolactone decarboxylase protein [Rhizobium etli bv. phaseoli str. IE4803]EGE61594.1 gamma-carboxymuconolactone decarboxylase protein [Rhizobium etli CNPAF512]KEC70786.1 gamma-carboxymuconolactone decarboxylase [Rhizobium leguminosarum bv. phaseoli CCGM1]AAM54965.1 gamma-carboxymuconolactone decarboxylase prote